MIWIILLFAMAVKWYTISQLQIHGKLKWKGKFWSEDSWMLKYKEGMPVSPDNWYYRTFKILFKERFPGAATVFVIFTDGYHLSQFFFKSFLCLAIAVIYGPWVGLGCFILWGVVFTLVYRWLSK